MQNMDFSNFLLKRSTRGSFSDQDSSRMAAMIVQHGKCFVSGRPLKVKERELHHRIPKSCGGGDSIDNLIYLDRQIHRLIHTENSLEYTILKEQLKLNDEQMQLVDQLRFEAFRQK